MVKNKFTGLDIDKDNIINLIKEFFEKRGLEAQVSAQLVDIGNQKRCLITLNAQEYYLDVWFNKNGTTTLGVNGGAKEFLELKREMCQYIKDNSKKNSLQNNESQGNQPPFFTVKDVREEEVEQIIALVKQSDYFGEIIEDGMKKPLEKIWQFKDCQQNKLTIHWYDTGSLVLQGRPRFLFLETVYTMTELLNIEDIQTSWSDTTLSYKNYDSKALDKEFKKLLPLTYEGVRSNKLHNCIKQAVLFRTMMEDWPDNTAYVLIAYRALEGHLKFVLKDMGIDTGSNNFNMFNGSSFELDPSYDGNVDSCFPAIKVQMLSYLSSTYQIIKQERNAFLHWAIPNEGIDSTLIIATVAEAHDKIDKCLQKIEEYYRITR